ncbi:DUF6461 domain-containing protein [Streptomyces sp. NPDC056486]|uniref:DUF6461 domain-containing protein n=1 Tax=Streptomyces sp. NPDC056486 TaxID=3345835 RepID=UPI00368F1F7A
MSDGLTWLANSDVTWAGYCVTLARGLEPDELVRRLARGEPGLLGEYTGGTLEDFLERRDAPARTAVRYGSREGLSFAVAYGDWPGYTGPGFTDGLSRGAHIFQLYYESDNPKVPPPSFSYFHQETYMCGFDLCSFPDVGGTEPELILGDVQAAGIEGEEDRDAAHARSLSVVEDRFGLSLPRMQILEGLLPAATI